MKTYNFNEGDLMVIIENAVASALGAAGIQSIQETVKKHDKIINGNGRPGMVEDLATLRPLVDKFGEYQAEFTEFQLQTKVDRQVIFSDLKAIQDSLKAMKEAQTAATTAINNKIDPLLKLDERYLRVVAIASSFCLVLGWVGAKTDVLQLVISWLK